MRFARKHLEPFGRDCRGTSILEMAVILPVLLAIGLGVLEFGNVIYSYHLIAVGVRDAGRYVAGLPQQDASGNSLVSANNTAAQYIATRGVISGGTNRVSWWNPGDVSVAYVAKTNDATLCGTAPCRGGATITVVTVSTNVTYKPLGFLGILGLGTIPLHAEHEERLFGVR